MGRFSTVLCGVLLTVGCGDDSAGPADAPAPDTTQADGSDVPDAGPCMTPDDCDDRNPCTDQICTDGVCTNPIYREGEPCNDADPCTGPDLCAAGVCTSTPLDCSGLTDFCHVGVCDELADPTTGGCKAEVVADDTPCDDGLFCTVGDVCTGGTCGGGLRDCSTAADDCNTAACDEATGTCVPVPVTNDTPCEDGFTCTGGDSCQAGACVGGPPPSCDDTNACTIDTCDLGSDTCVNTVTPIPGAEGPFGDATCGNGTDDDCDGATDTADTDCVQCTSPAQCDDGNVCTGDGCSGGSCTHSPVGGSCEDGDYCTTGDACSGGACMPGTPRTCSDANACTLDVCNESTNACENPARTVDPASLVATSSDQTAPIDGCLTAGAGGHLVAWTVLRDTLGVSITGASVTIGGGAATEAATQPGTYYRVLDAAGSPMSQTVSVVATACGSTVTLSTTIALVHAPANASAGGLGGCSPAGGNLRVKVVSETGAVLSGASVMIGQAQGTPFQTAPTGLFGGATASASNVATTNGSGYATFLDYGNVLDTPFTVTAGAANRAYVTVIAAEASDVVLALPQLHPAPPTTTTYDMGTGTPYNVGCSDVDAGLVLPKLDLSFFSDLRLSRFFEKSVCWDHGNGNLSGGNPIAIPQNLWIPSQQFEFLCLGGSLAEAPWSLTLANGTTENVELLQIDMPATQAQPILDSGAGFNGLLAITRYKNAGFLLNESVPTPPTSGRSINVNAGAYSSSNTFSVTYGARPAESDVIGLTIGDYAGTNGVGPLFLIGHKVHKYSDSGSTVAIPNNGYSPTSFRRLAAVTAMYMDPTVHGAIAANRLSGRTTVLLRGTASTPPFGGTAATASFSEFLDIAATTYGAPRDFRWTNATLNGHVPRYSRHDLVVETDSYLPVLSCQATNDVRTSDSVQWIVYKPFGLGCGSDECFTLPTLPGSFPRAGTAAQRKEGFEALVGTGVTCAGAGGCTAGETCVDPDGAGTAPRQCMAGAGSAADPYRVQKYVWRLHVYDLALAVGWDFDSFVFATHAATVTHESANDQLMP